MTSKPMALRWIWIPSLYLAEGLPYVLVMSVSVIFYKDLGVSNTDIALYTSLLYLPWVIKPIWSPMVDVFLTKRFWILAMQCFLAFSIAGLALSSTHPGFFPLSLSFFWVLAFSSATHDIAVDGYYMLALSKPDQALFVGVRSTFYRVAMIAGQGLLVILAGFLETRIGRADKAWMLAFLALASLFLVFFVFHALVLPRPPDDARRNSGQNANPWRAFSAPFFSFFKKEGLFAALAFLLFYRFSEAQLVKMAAPFLKESRDLGGLGLSNIEFGFIYGTVGLICLIAGGLLGGIAIARKGFGSWLWWMVAAINLPNAVYLVMSIQQPEAMWVIGTFVAIEQFGYGFGFTAYMMYMIARSDGPHKTAHFALCTGFMAIGMMLPGMVSGWIQSVLGYRDFFIWVMLCTVPAFFAARSIRVTDDFGRKTA